MANISQLIQKIRSAIYGEEVRGSICDALTAMNTETESYVEQAAAQVELATQQAENSSASATASAGSATSSANSAITSKSWAVGGTGTREGEDTNNAKYWCDQAREAGGDVTGVKGNEETEYRTGNVNLTCENIGAATASDMEQAQSDINQLNQSLSNKIPYPTSKIGSATFNTTKAYGNYSAVVYMYAKNKPTLTSVILYEGFEPTDITSQCIVTDYYESNFTIKCENDNVAGGVIVFAYTD